jgi:hypothetical protein
MSKFKVGEKVLLNGKEYRIVGTIKRSFKLERDGKFYKATAKMMSKIQNQNEMGIGVGNYSNMEKRLAYKKIFDPNAKMPETEDEHMDWFSDISCELSPENLHCDGEISHAAAMRKYRALKAEWKEVEKSLGRKVSEDEADSWWMKKRYGKKRYA